MLILYVSEIQYGQFKPLPIQQSSSLVHLFLAKSIFWFLFWPELAKWDILLMEVN